MSRFDIQPLSGQALEPVFSELADLRIQIFRDFPYLYEGSLAYEKKYLKRYSDCADSVLVVIRDQGKMIGASTGLPLIAEEDFVQKPFLLNQWNLEDVFYFGESLLLPQYRGQGLGHVFFDEREKFAVEKLKFKITCFCAVQRPSDHPLRPQNYQPLDAFWKKRGYTPQSQLKAEFSWQDLTEKNESLKPMQFWVKWW